MVGGEAATTGMRKASASAGSDQARDGTSLTFDVRREIARNSGDACG
jgi:hypothetical protein